MAETLIESPFAAMEAAAATESDREDEDFVILPCGRKVRREPEKERVRIVLRDFCFENIASVEYALEVEGEVFKGKTGDDGLVDHLIDKGAKSGTLTVWYDGREKGEPMEWELELGALDPETVEEGFADRMLNLGLVPQGTETAGDEDVEPAIESLAWDFDGETMDDSRPFSGSEPQEIMKKLYRAEEWTEFTGGRWTPDGTDE